SALLRTAQSAFRVQTRGLTPPARRRLRSAFRIPLFAAVLLSRLHGVGRQVRAGLRPVELVVRAFDSGVVELAAAVGLAANQTLEILVGREDIVGPGFEAPQHG